MGPPPILCLTALAVIASACAPAAGATPSAHPSATATTSPTTAPTQAPTTGLAACPAPVALAQLPVLHHFTVSPDDIAVDAAGHLLVSERTVNAVVTLDASGSVLSTQTVAGGPEGIAVLGASVFVAQQGRNAVVETAPAIAPVLSLPNPTRNAGIDGIAADAAGQRLLIPDSPVGRLYALPLAGPGTPSLLATGLGRPVDAAVDPSGDVFVASESSPGLTELGGTRRTLGAFTDLDEVVWFGGLLYITDLQRDEVAAIDPVTGRSAILATGFPAPQGLAVDAHGTLYVVDATDNIVTVLRACGVAR